MSAEPSPRRLVTWDQVKALAALAPPAHRTGPAPPSPRPKPTGPDLANRIRAYLRRVPPAVSGQHGHDRTFYAAGRLVRGFDLSPADALPYLLEWNERCTPPWSEADVLRKLQEAAKQAGPRGELLDRYPAAGPGSPGCPACPTSTFTLANFYEEEADDGETKKPVVRGRAGFEILDDLTDATGGWPKVCGDVLFVPDPDDPSGVRWIASAESLFSWIDKQLGSPGRPGVKWTTRVPGCLTKGEFLETVRQQCTERFEAVASVPHEPRLAGHFYARPEPPPPDPPGSALAGFLRLLAPATPEDSELVRAMLMTLRWGGPPGSRPAFVITTPDGDKAGGRGTGKSTLAKFAARIAGGSLSLRQGEDFQKFMGRVLSPSGLGKTVVLVDNLKTMKFSWADLEAFITSDVLSGHRLYEGEGQRPNTITTIITINGPALSKDIAQRCVTIHLARPDYTPEWEEEVNRYLDTHLDGIQADLLAELRQPAGALTVPFRWGMWQRAVLSKLPDPDALVRLIRERQDEADEDAAEAGLILEAILAAVQLKTAGNPERYRAFLTSKAMARIATEATGEKRAINQWSRMLSTMTIRGLRKGGDTGHRGWFWYGSAYQEGESNELDVEE